MNRQISGEFGAYFARIPLTSTPHIRHGNALRIDWSEVLPAARCSYVFGNPPFVGKKEQDTEQKQDVAPIFAPLKGGGVLDLVAAWYIKAAQYFKLPPPRAGQSWGEDADCSAIRCAFVSTNSITQGEQVGVLWGWLIAQGIKIHFAHRTFRWSNEASGKAAVHCVIVGFGLGEVVNKTIYEYDDVNGEPHAVVANHINAYFVDAPQVALVKRSTPICHVPPINYGSMALDDGHLLLTREERDELVALFPQSESLVRPFMGGEEFLNRGERFCLWLAGVPASVIRMYPPIIARLEATKKYRESSGRETTQKMAATASLFGENRQPST
jgi:hypothetical protein